MSPDESAVIRTPDQRLRVFVSSTLAELAEERAAVARAITSLGLAPVMFELGARPHPPQELYRAYLAQSDVFIGLYWESYGWVGPGMDISGLEDEFRLSGGRPRLLYLKAPAPERQPRLEAMIDEIRTQGTDAYRTFRSTRELGRLVRDDLALLLSERFVSSARAAAAPRTDAVADAPAAVAPRRTLPVPATSLVGRDDDVAAVVTLLRAADVRLVTVTGPGGMGKTRVAIAVGEALAAADPPLLFVPLADATDEGEVLPRIASAADVVIEGTRSIREILVDHFSSRPTVMILDNLEQVTAVAPELDALLASCPGLKILATSRIALRLRAEHEYVLPPLETGSEPGDRASIDDALLLPAVQLFLDRADAVGRRVDSSPRSIRAVLEICRRLDGLPLAIELAAARTRLLDPVAVLARLENVLDALGSGPVDLPERQRGLRATVEWSVGLLGEEERRLLSRLSVFVGGWTVSAAAAVAGLDDDAALDLLDLLVGNSLVVVTLGEDEPRFRMLTAVREYAAELLTGEDRAEAERCHARHFADLAESDVDAADRSAWGERLHTDEDNLRAAIRWFFAHDIARLPHLFRALWLYWQVYDRMSEARHLAGELQRVVRPGDLDERAETELLFTIAVTSTEVGDDQAALDAVDAIAQRMAALRDPELRDALLLADSWVRPLRGDLDGALASAEAAYAGYASREDLFVAAAALTIGMLRMALGDDDSARRYLMEVDEFGGRLDIQWLTAAGLTHLAIMDVRSDATEAARDRLRRLLSRLDDDRTVTLSASLILAAFGDLSLAEGRAEPAATAVGAIDGLRRRTGVAPWPNSRGHEEDLRRRVRAEMTPAEWDRAYDAGTALRLTEAMAVVREAVGAPAGA
jgi:predicted ATPase